ncbi:alcohol oxidase [Xylariaceae sp. FL1272]|nr:alcohol oxidase [Xylariaceae sp. FL1272]
MKLLLPLTLSILPSAFAFPSHGNESTTEYDYVVVGSGAGGGTVASSLARKGYSVFLIEAGGDLGTTTTQECPAGAPAENPEMSWRFFIRHYRDEAQAKRDTKFVYRLPDGQLYWGLDPPQDAEPLGTIYPRGATVGGSTQVNAMVYARARDSDWDDIANLTGDVSWSATAMAPYAIELEKAVYVPPGTPNHGFNGFYSSNHNNISYVTSRPGLTDVLYAIANETEDAQISTPAELGELMQRDIHSKEYFWKTGVYQLVESTTEKRRRSGIRNYVIDTIEARKTDGSPKYPLTLSPYSLATRVLFSEDGSAVPKAYGVEYLVGEALYAADRRYNASQTGELKTVTARKEVIISGGTINTPQILKLSGIGSRGELEALAIPVVVDLPAVGTNVQDHTEGIVRLDASAPWPNDPYARCDFTLIAGDPCYDEWLTSGTGPYGEGGAPLSFRFRSSVADDPAGEADVWAFGLPNNDFHGFYPGYSTAPPVPEAFAFSMVKVKRPGDRTDGTVTLRSNDPRDTPFVVVNWLQGERGEHDLQALTESAETLHRSFDSAPAFLQPIKHVQPAEGENITQSLRDQAFGHHMSSSCRIGAADDEGAVVDHQLRVRGVTGLRVVDASIFPHTPSAFPTVPTIMMALKAADMIAAGLY